MTIRSSRLLRRQVARILERCGIEEPPVPLSRIADEFGAEIRFVPYEGELAGMVARHTSGKSVIGVNSKLSKSRQRYTIAHELGHLLLHDLDMHIDRDFRIAAVAKEVSEPQEALEIEANRFAVELLMPYDMVTADLEQNGIDLEHLEEATTLSRRYDVSLHAMMHRIANIAQF